MRDGHIAEVVSDAEGYIASLERLRPGTISHK